MVRSSRIRSTSESCSSNVVNSSNDPASSTLADVTTLATACRNASRNSGWSSAITRRVLAAAVIDFSQEVACRRLSSDRPSGASAQLYHASKRLTRVLCDATGLKAEELRMRSAREASAITVQRADSLIGGGFTAMLARMEAP